MRILVVEDNSKLAASLKKGLQQEGYAVDVALDGTEGQGLLDGAGEGYDAVVLDLMLPGIDGMTLCRNIRAAGNRVPVLILTARGDVSDRVDGLDAGADDYLAKPFAFEELAARIRALLRRPAVPIAPVMRAGDLEMNAALREVTVRGRAISLTAKEFSLLELFLRHPRQVLSREQITVHLWDQEFEGNSNVVEVHVRNVRRKLSEAGNHGQIETVRGAGYRLAD
ncbi:MAG: response regulator transcription factor [Spirochaetia bacterium]|jgi:two-component system OmpR family response regulator